MRKHIRTIKWTKALPLWPLWIETDRLCWCGSLLVPVLEKRLVRTPPSTLLF